MVLQKSTMRAVPVTAEQVSHLRDYAKDMIGRGVDPLPDHDYPIEIEGSGLSSVFGQMVPLLKQAWKYGKPLAKKIGAIATAALATRAADKLAGRPHPGQTVLQDIARQGRDIAVKRVDGLKRLGVDETQKLANQTIDAAQKATNTVVDSLQARAQSTVDKAQSKAREMAEKARVTSEGLSDVQQRALLRARSLAGSGHDEKSYARGFEGSGVRFSDGAGAPNRGFRTAKNMGVGAFRSGRFVGRGMFQSGGALYPPGRYTVGLKGGCHMEGKGSDLGKYGKIAAGVGGVSALVNPMSAPLSLPGAALGGVAMAADYLGSDKLGLWGQRGSGLKKKNALETFEESHRDIVRMLGHNQTTSTSELNNVGTRRFGNEWLGAQ